MSVRLVVSINAAPGKGAELAAEFRTRCAEVMQEPGCEQFEVFQSVLNPDKLALLELWKDQAALDVHARVNTTRPPMPAGLRADGGSREDYEYNKVRLAPARPLMKVSYFETGRYQSPADMPGVWPMPSGAYDIGAGADIYRGMVERISFVEQLGFDWVSLSEHHYSPRILTPSPPMAAAYLASRVHKIKFALLGPIVSHSNPVRLAEELAMLDTMAGGRLVVGLLRGTTNEALTYDLNPQESRDRTDEGMELILKAWTEPQPFGWQGRHFRYRTVSVWPRPLQQPHPPTFALGTSREAGEFAARNRIGLGVSYGPFEVMGKATGYYREQCAQYGWHPTADQIIFRANIVLGETDAEAERAMQTYPARAPFALGEGIASALLELDSRNIAGEARPASINRALPINFVGGPDTVVEQIRRCRELTGAGIIDLGFNTPGTADPKAHMAALELFGRKVLPRIRDI